jgi:CubicO group peptidase (beta-lactamase class C family)
MMNYLKTIPFVLFLFVFVPYCSAQTEQLHSYLEVIHAKKHFNGELLVAKGDRILFHEAIGLASIEHNVAMETDAVYRIASITKSFTGTLIAMAEQ